MDDPRRLVIGIKSLIKTSNFIQAHKRLREALNLNLDEETRHQVLLLTIDVSILLGEKIPLELLAELEDFLKSAKSNEAIAETLHAISRAELRMGRFHEATILERLQNSLGLYQNLSKPKATVSVLNTLAAVYAKQGNWDDLLKPIAEVFKLAIEAGDSQGYGRALLYFAFYERMHGRHNLAIDHYKQASQLLEGARDSFFLAIALNNLADLEITLGHLSKGLPLLQRALFLWRTIGHKEKIALILTQIARINVLKGNIPEAKVFFDLASNVVPPEQSRNPLELVFELCILAELERNQGKLNQALQLTKKAITLLDEMDNAGGDLAYAWGLTTDILLDMQNISEAEKALEMCEMTCGSLEYSEGIVNNIRLRGVLELQKNNFGLAQDYLQAARERAEQKKYVQIQIQTELRLADLFLRQLPMKFSKSLRKNAKECLLRASRLAEQNSLKPGKLEAQILQAVAHSINIEFEKASELLTTVETTARSLELHLIEKKAHEVKLSVDSKLELLKLTARTDLSTQELQDYLSKAQAFIVKSQATFRSALAGP
ncbi:MAG: tetratricopeptide repeat protein [Candidatus Heimdallarchaeota archaeon]